MRTVKARAARYAQSDLPILIRGETGVGKDVMARGIHSLSNRSRGPFVVVNCAALPPTLVESEFFGTVSGAFTGATARRGWFRRAAGGTLLLDEIGDMPLDAQRVLLRVLEEPQVWPLGGERPIDINCRVLCATHQDLESLVASRAFRADLFHRIAVLTVRIPPLRERLEDIEALARHFILSDGAITPAAIRRLKSHHWPGNVRELKNTVLAAEVEASGQAISAEHIAWTVSIDRGIPLTGDAPKTLTHAIQTHIQKVLSAHAGNVRATARTLRVSPTTIYRYLSLPNELPTKDSTN